MDCEDPISSSGTKRNLSHEEKPAKEKVFEAEKRVCVKGSQEQKIVRVQQVWSTESNREIPDKAEELQWGKISEGLEYHADFTFLLKIIGES